jgi:outer membrane receptor protein involved in Fe transport
VRTASRTPSTLFTLAAGALCVSSAWSQAAPEPAASASGAEPAAANQVEVVTVTAQRREQVITKVPMSVAALGTQALDKLSIKDIADISHVTPGLVVSSADPSGEAGIAIRGISSVVGAATTGIYIDDAPVQIGNIAGCPFLCVGSPLPRIFDLDRVEVLRGPQGTLYGSSSEGGAVRFITAAPKLEGAITGAAHLELAAQQGGDPSAEAGVVMDAPLVKDVAGLRASLWDQHAGGHVDAYSPSTGALVKRNIDSSDAQVARLALRIEPTDALTITPSYYFQNVKQAGRATFSEALGVDKSNFNIAQPDHDRFGIAALTVEYDFQPFSLKAIASNLHRRQDRTDDYSNFGEGREIVNNLDVPAGLPPTILPLHATKGQGTAAALTRSTQDNWTEELRLTSNDRPGDRFSWIAGAYVQVARQGYGQVIHEDVAKLSSIYDALWNTGGAVFDPADPLGNDTSYAEHDLFRTSEQALYGEASYKLTPALGASLGLRATRTTASFDSTLDGWWSGGTTHYTGRGVEHPITPKLGLSWQATADTLVYATAAKGFRAGGANPSLASNPSCQADLAALGGNDVEPLLYKSDSVWSYELGSKHKLAGGAVQVNGSLYWIAWNDIQTQVALPTCGFGYIANMAKASSKGFDLEVQARPTGNLTLSASLGLDKAQYTQSVANAGFALGLSPVPYLVKSGDPLPTPRWTAALGAEYGWRVSDNPAFLRADYQFASAYDRTGSAGTQTYDPDTRRTGTLRLVNLRTGVKVGAWDWSLYLKNAFDARTEMSRFHSYSQSIVTGAPSPLYDGQALPPRTLGASANVKF